MFPRISIVTPSYNQAPYLEQTIESVLGQDYPNLEYMVVDGASTDGSREIIENYADQLAWWVSEPDDGQTDAINKGLRRVTGDVIAYLNSDDLYEPDTFARVAAFFEAHPDVDIVYSDLTVIDAEGERKGVWRSRPFDPVTLLCRNFIFQPTVFIRRRVFDEIGLFDPLLHYVMDVDFWYRALTDFQFAFLGQPLAAFRLHEDSKTCGSRVPFVQERGRILERFLSACKDDNILRQRHVIRSWHHYHGAEQLYQRGELAEARVEFMQAIQQDFFSRKTLMALAGVCDGLLGTRNYTRAQRVFQNWVNP